MIRKTDLDIKREEKILKLNKKIPIRFRANRDYKRGPYNLEIRYLSYKKLIKTLKFLKENLENQIND